MACNKIDAGMVVKMFLAGAQNLEAKKEWINELNVFPVPDGDTGTNMTMTILAAAKEVASLENPKMPEVARAIASGSLRGARGNSGVILSQLFRGFTKGIQDYEEVTVPILADAFTKAVDTAYKAVMKPKEGTILTVAKGVAQKGVELAEEGETDLEAFFGQVIEHAEYVLNQTPEMLPVLKQAGVVDSGGQGLVEVLKGCNDAFLGKEVVFEQPERVNKAVSDGNTMPVQQEADIKFGYCTEFIIMLEKPVSKEKENQLKAYLESIGDSIVVVADEEIIKVHVHTNDPGLAIQKALTYGALSNMKIDNMRLEHHEKVIRMAETAQTQEQPDEQAERKAVGFVAVSMGEGMEQIFKELGVDYVLSGGQTMNPSTEDILDAVDRVNADTVFILPNNKNIILAANQAQSMSEDKKIVVIPTKTVPQGITAVINYVPELSIPDNESAMLNEIARVKTGQVTYAVRDTSIDGREIHQGDYMGIGDQGILSVSTDIRETVFEMMDQMIDADTELISIYYGKDVEPETAEAVCAEAESRYPGCDVELQSGGQPVYYYIISAE
ncbi:MAG: DAK2 domain-containing protein [Lachnospiraceae bacterium]|nr:DAK2 domain-containing protein [Lachnospiraceae bacterium]